MTKQDNAMMPPVLELLEGRLLLSGQITALPPFGTSMIDLWVPGPVGNPALTGRASSVGATLIRNYQFIPDYDFWYGSAPTVGGMETAWWDLAMKLRTMNLDAGPFPGDYTRWQFNQYPSLTNDVFGVPTNANGVVSGWQHQYDATWNGASRSWTNDTYQGHLPDSIADFMKIRGGGSDTDAIAWGMHNFMSWDDPRTAWSDSYDNDVAYGVGDVMVNPPNPTVVTNALSWDDYKREIVSGRPVQLWLANDDPNVRVHRAVLGVGYYEVLDPQTGLPTEQWYDVLTTNNNGVQEFNWLGDTVAGIPGQTYVIGGMMMDVKLPAQGLTGYLAVGSPYAGNLNVTIGLGNPNSPLWSTNVFTPAPAFPYGANLVISDIDLSAAMPLLSQSENWFLKVHDSSSAQLDTVMDFQIRYNGYRWFTSQRETPVNDPDPVTGMSRVHDGIVQLTSDVMGSIAGAVYDDLDGNGVRDAGEPGLFNWRVYLDANNNGALDGTETSVTTNASGNYVFPNVPMGLYRVAEVLQAGFGQTAPATGSHVGTLFGQAAANIDFGNAVLTNMGGTAWNDVNRDGIQDAGELPIANLTLFMDANANGTLDAGEASTATNASGVYQFQKLPGAYTLTALPPAAGWLFSNPASGSRSVTLISGANQNALNFGLYLPTLPDLMDNGDAGSTFTPTIISPGLPWSTSWQIRNNATVPAGAFQVSFYASTDNTIAATDTLLGTVSMSGLAASAIGTATLNLGTFPSLPAGNYYVGVIIDSTGAVAEANEANNIGLDQNLYPLRVPGISGMAWFDANGNGAIDGTERPLPNWTLYLDQNRNGIRDTGEVSATTDATGQYSFTNLMPGTYYVAEVLATGWTKLTPSGANYQLALASNQLIQNVNFGNSSTLLPELRDDGDAFSSFAPSSVISPGGTWDVWWDVRNAGTGPSGAFRVEFWASVDNTLTTLADNYLLGYSMVPSIAAGQYADVTLSLLSFPNLMAGDYHVGVIIDSDNKVFESDETNNIGMDADYYPLTVVNLADLQDGLDSLSTFTPTTVDPGQKWQLAWGLANTGNGATGAFRVDFYASGNNVITNTDYLLGSVSVPTMAGNSTMTIALSTFSFPNIPGGQYYIGAIIDAGKTVAELNEANNVALDQSTYPLSVTRKLPAVEGIVYEDVNGNGVQDTEDPGKPGFIVFADTLLANGQPDLGEPFAFTDASGQYVLNGLQAGTWDIVRGKWDGWTQTVAGSLSESVTLTASSVVTGVDFAAAQLSKIAGIVWQDLDGSGTVNTVSGVAEPHARAVRVSMYRDYNTNGRMDAAEAGTLVWMPSGIDGEYEFRDLAPGTYVLQMELPAGRVYTSPNNGQQSITITSAELRGNVDFGEAVPVSIHGVKYNDLNANGVRDANEPGLAGWVIYLDQNTNGALDPDENWTTTDGTTGRYHFNGLAPGTYNVAEVMQNGWAQSEPAATGIWQVTLNSFQISITADFGNYQVCSISGFKYHDLDADGVMKVGSEPGLPGWTIQAVLDANNNGVADAGETTLTMITDATGAYSFANLRPGTYIISEVQQAPWQESAPGNTPTTDHHDLFVSSGQSLTAISFGNFMFGQISGAKWHDLNADGIMDPAEPGLQGWTIFLDQNYNGVLEAGETSTLTDANGNYTFIDLIPGPFRVVEQGQVDWFQSAPATVFYDVIISSGLALTGKDFGNYGFAEIHGTMWHDLNADGVADPGEPGLGGVTVFLDANGNGLLESGETSTTTAADGTYAFTGLMPGFYVIDQVLPAGWSQSLPVNQPNFLSVLSKDIVSGVDFADYTTGEIRGLKWQDTNGNGTRDLLEPGLANWRIYLDNNSNGAYDSTGVLNIHGVPVTPAQSAINDFATTSFWIDLTGLTGPILDLDFGVNISHARDSDLLVKLISPSGQQITLVNAAGGNNRNFIGTIFDDEATMPIANGTAPFTGSFIPEMPLSVLDGQDPNGIWYLEVYDSVAGSIGRVNSIDFYFTLASLGDPTVLTDANGAYAFTGLQPGSYTVAEVQQSGYVQTAPATGTQQVTVTSGLVGNNVVNFGNVPPGSISGVKWHDFNGNGAMDAGEPGLAGWTISAFRDANGNAQPDAGEQAVQAVTDGAGNYTLSNLIPGPYVVGEQSQAGWVQTAPVPGTYSIALTAAQNVTGIKFGNAQPVTIDGFKWHDLNANGVKDFNEPGLINWTIFIDANRNGQLNLSELYTTTAADGSYSFTGLLPGAYTVAEVAQPTWMRSTPISGGYNLVLTSAQTAANTNFGNYQYGRVSGVKWHDLDADGVRDPNEPTLAGWTIFADFDGNGTLGPGEISSLTNGQGQYTLTGLTPGQYKITEVLKPGWQASVPAAGVQTVTVVSGATTPNSVFGNYQYARVSGRLWLDNTHDGLVDPTEPGLAGWTVTLFEDPNGTGVQDPAEQALTTTTDASGAFSFTTVKPGIYVVQEVAQPGYVQTSPLGQSYSMALTSGQAVDNLLFGNDALPVAVDSTGDGQEDQTFTGQLAATDSDQDILAFMMISTPSHGQLLMNIDGSFSYVPDANWHGVDSFQFYASDGMGDSSPATFTLNIAEVNDKPQAIAPANQPLALNEDSSIQVLLNSSDIETPVTAMIYQVATAPQHGSLVISGSVATYTPNADWNGTDSFSFVAVDTGDGASPALTSDPASVSLLVNPINDVPTANGQLLEIIEGAPTQIILTGADVETASGNLTFIVTTQPLHGAVTINGSVATYTPEAGFYGLDSFQFATVDGGEPAGSNVATSQPATVDVDVVRVISFSAASPASLQLLPSWPVLLKATLRGKGQGKLFVSTLPGTGERYVKRMELTGTDAASQLGIATTGVGPQLTVGDITVFGGSLKGIKITAVQLNGNVRVDGSLGSFQANKLAAGRTIRIGASKVPTTFKLDKVADLSILSGSPIKTLLAAEWTDSDATPDMIDATSIGKLQIKGDRKRGLMGNFQAGLNLDSGAVKTLGSAVIAGHMSDSDWDILGGVGAVKVGGMVSRSAIRASGNIGAVTFGGSDATDLLAGIADPAGKRHALGGDFATAATIRSFKIAGIKKLPGNWRDLFVDSNLSASSIGNIGLMNPDFLNDTTFGIFGAASGELGTVKITDTRNGTAWPWPPTGLEVPPGSKLVVQKL